MKGLFEVAGGSVVGRDHRRAGRNNQDAYYYRISDDSVVAVVCDGCGSGKHSEVGAKIGARLIVETMTLLAGRFEADNIWWERVRQDVLAQLRVLALRMSNSLSEAVNDFLLFAAVGVVITKQLAGFFSLGDGFIIVNGSILELGPFPNNEPPYLSYGLVGSSLQDRSPDLLRFNPNPVMSTEEVSSFLIGTDGLTHLICAAEECIPGKDELVGPISQFWEEDRYYTNPDNVRRRLTLVNREIVQPDWKAQVLVRQGGHLPDDVTLIVGRRRKQGGITQ